MTDTSKFIDEVVASFDQDFEPCSGLETSVFKVSKNETKTRREWIKYWAKEKFIKVYEAGRGSVLDDFDAVCQADAFIGFTDAEWQAVKKFFAFNRALTTEGK